MEGEGVGRQRVGSLDYLEEEGEVYKWLWVGMRNLLMGGKEESEWIMERLMERLKEVIVEDMEKW